MVSIYTDSGWNGALSVSLYDWQMQNWIELKGVELGDNMVSQAASLISPNGIIQVRLEGRQDMMACFYLGMGLEGWKQ